MATHHWADKEPLASKIIRKGSKLLEEIIPNDNEAKGRCTISRSCRFCCRQDNDQSRGSANILLSQIHLHVPTAEQRNWQSDTVPSKYCWRPDWQPVSVKNACQWLIEKDARRLDMANLPRPNTKWAFQRWIQVEVKAILTEQPLLGQGPLPDWLRNKKGLYALDAFNDNLYLFRCLAVHQGAHPNRCTEQAKQLAAKFYFNDESVRLEAY